MDDNQTRRSKEALQHLYNNVLPQLATHIHQNLTDITPLFHDFGLEIVVDTWTKDPDAEEGTPISIENGNVQQMGLKLRLEGFERAGAPPFDITKDLLLKLGYMSYEVGPGKNVVWLEKMYCQNWTKQEYEEIAGKWSEELIEEITQRLQSLH
ncbi:hypothetical protein [Pontibacter liquoris]|uniref:hypothetical protein n=1 Tax=Pontibacter liquoris TaxID=2905677 RepID=UPI001FA80B38|nr:hypothetical protein [Pontibacter liquoris]